MTEPPEGGRMRLGTLLPLALLLAGCKCLPVPASDTTPPTPVLTIEYTDMNGTVRTQMIGSGTPAMTIDFMRSRDLTVLVSGTDNEGVRSVHLDYDMDISSPPGTIIQPILEAIGAESSCPRQTLTQSHTFTAPPTEILNYTFSCRAVNWLNLSRSTAVVTMRPKD